MAKTSTTVRNRRRAETVARYARRRAELRELRRTGTPGERASAQRALQALPRDASPVRLRNRDPFDGRPRGYVGAVGVSRVRLRELAHAGHLPGVTRSSW
ncbi:30S ribosomal protein S14 [Janibacter melonis]|uniref:30S ribosomal protein S14 n=1 Tax=Janibacter melonis TaxID=262209 RepID=UPI001E55F663|nr:30S ribosomal protein S14 [Janibacter melonis]MCB5992025.1 30S ribosomal protein S14 [Janibacter melonis]